MKFILDFSKGVLIGAGCILPGISSGVLCVIFGIYDKLLNSILNFFKDIKSNSKFLAPIGLGGITGVFLFSKILKYVLNRFPVHTKSLFIGLILGGIVLIFKEVSSKQKFKLKDLICIITTLTLGIFMVYLEKNMSIAKIESVNYIYLIFSGFLMSIGIVVPGVSSTIILMLLGCYSIYLSSISSLYLPVLIPIGIGLIIGSLIFIKIIKILLDRYYTKTMYSIIGFTIGSILVLFPEISNEIEIIISLFCLILGYTSIRMIEK